MFNPNHTSSYRRLFRIVTASMDNWKMPITVCVDTADMRGASENERMLNAIKRMQRIQKACMFMVGRGQWDAVRILDNADGSGRTMVYKNAGYYKNIGA